MTVESSGPIRAGGYRGAGPPLGSRPPPPPKTGNQRPSAIPNSDHNNPSQTPAAPRAPMRGYGQRDHGRRTEPSFSRRGSSHSRPLAPGEERACARLAQAPEAARLVDDTRGSDGPRRRAGSSGGKRPGANGARSMRCAAPSRINSLIASPVAGALSMPQTLWPAATQAPSIPGTAPISGRPSSVTGRKHACRALIGAAASAGEIFRHSASSRACAPLSGATSAGSTGTGSAVEIAHTRVVPSARGNSSGVRISPLASRYSRNSASAGMVSPVANTRLWPLQPHTAGSGSQRAARIDPWSHRDDDGVAFDDLAARERDAAQCSARAARQVDDGIVPQHRAMRLRRADQTCRERTGIDHRGRLRPCRTDP